MIYVVLNNEYHWHDLKLHFESLKSFGLTVIAVPHNLRHREFPGASGSIRYELDFRSGWLGWLASHLVATWRVHRELSPARGDVCLLYTEYELLNQVIAGRFHTAGARVLLMEDGGFPTYLMCRIASGDALRIKEILKQWIYRLLPGLGRLRLIRAGDHVFRRMPDNHITSVLLYKQVRTSRNIPTVTIGRPPEAPLSTNPGTAIFLNENVYDGHIAPDAYFIRLTEMVSSLASAFGTVYFKFHPRDDETWRLAIFNRVLAQFPRVKILNEDDPIEAIVDRYRPAIAASFLSAALLNLHYRGVEPLYLYHLVPELANHHIYREATAVLEELGYNFVSSFDAVSPQFKSRLDAVSPRAGLRQLADVIG